MKTTSRCKCCSDRSDAKVCPNCGSPEMYTVYVCSVCNKAYFWSDNMKACCRKIKEEKKERK